MLWCMYVRFPELAPPDISYDPTRDDIESGMWCPSYFTPDEAGITKLDPALPVTSQFAAMTPRYLWLQSGKQTIVAVSAPHIHDPNNAFYDDLRSLYNGFVYATAGKERATLREGRKRQRTELVGNDAEIIIGGGDGLYLQSLASRNNIECHSTEPVDDKDILAIRHHYPDLRRAAVMYVKMRILPQAYRVSYRNPHT